MQCNMPLLIINNNRYTLYCSKFFKSMQKDTAIFDLINEELERQRRGLELIASENFASMQVINAMGSVMTNKYAEGYPGRRYYGGCEVVDKSETLALDRAKEIFGVSYANVQPHSGSQANAGVMMAVLNPGDSILGLDLSMGGHLTHGSSGKLFGQTIQCCALWCAQRRRLGGL